MRSNVVFGCFLLFVVCLLIGCGHAPQMSAPNRKILEALQSAVSSKKLEWIEAVVTQVAEKRTSKEMSDAEFTAINAIITKAKSGDWKGAQIDSFALSEGQRPTSQDLAMLKSRKGPHGAAQN